MGSVLLISPSAMVCQALARPLKKTSDCMKTFIHASTKLSTNRQMIVTANTEPIALSIVEGARSIDSLQRRRLEYWNDRMLE
jgi:hypothetical protein